MAGLDDFVEATPVVSSPSTTDWCDHGRGWTLDCEQCGRKGMPEGQSIMHATEPQRGPDPEYLPKRPEFVEDVGPVRQPPQTRFKIAVPAFKRDVCIVKAAELIRRRLVVTEQCSNELATQIVEMICGKEDSNESG
jgi:hypothetical protein